MEKSESIASLSKALVKAQSEFDAVKMNATNPFYHSKYADLGSVIQTCKPVLKANGLAVSQLVNGNTNQVGITTMLIHESGEYLSSEVVVPIQGQNIAQEAGKVVSYLRRYALASVLGLYSDEDTDAEKKHEAKVESKTATETFAKEVGAEVSKIDKGVMSLDFAKSVVGSDGIKYSELERGALAGIANAKAKKKKESPNEWTDADQMKLDAAKTLLTNWDKK